jgi:hypothetical protein
VTGRALTASLDDDGDDDDDDDNNNNNNNNTKNLVFKRLSSEK